MGAIDIKDAGRGCECLKWETQSFSDQDIDEGGISSAIQQCRDSVVVLSAPHGNSYINEELAVLVDSAGIDMFSDLVSDRKRAQFFFVVFVDGMKHSIRAAAALWASRRRCLLSPKPRYNRIFVRKQNCVS